MKMSDKIVSEYEAEDLILEEALESWRIKR